MRAANFSARAESVFDRNRHRTTIAENSSMALSPPNPRRAGLRAAQAAASAIIASAVIQMTVNTWRLSTRRRTSGADDVRASDILTHCIVHHGPRGAVASAG